MKEKKKEQRDEYSSLAEAHLNFFFLVHVTYTCIPVYSFLPVRQPIPHSIIWSQ